MQFLHSLDQYLFHLINVKMANPYFDLFFPAITDLHKTNIFRIVFIPALLLIWLYLYRLRGMVMFFVLAISLGVSDSIGAVAKRFWLRARPFEVEAEFVQRSAAGGFSFPSNHALNMFCAACFLTALFPRYRILFFTIAVLVAFSRVYNGVHYPFDVIGGAAIGSFIGTLGGLATVQINDRIAKGFKRKKRKQKNV